MKDLKLDVSGSGKLTSDDIDALYNALQQGLLTDDSSLVGQCTADNAYEDAASALHERFPQFSVEALKLFVRFKDKEVLRVLLANAQHEYADGLMKEELAAVTSIGTWFYGNTEIESFEELAESGVTQLVQVIETDNGQFQGCSNLKNIDLSKIVYYKNASLNGTQVKVIKLFSCKFTYGFSGNGTETTEYQTNGGFLITDGLVILPKFESGPIGCYYCRNTTFDFGNNVSTIAIRTFEGANNFVFRKESVPTLDWGFYKTPKAIFVPSSALATYKAASGWSSYASKIYPIGGPEWQAEFGSSDEYADIDKYVEDPAEREKIKEAYRNA